MTTYPAFLHPDAGAHLSVRLNFAPPAAPQASAGGVLHVPVPSASAPWVLERPAAPAVDSTVPQQGSAWRGERAPAKETDWVATWDQERQAYLLAPLQATYTLRHDRTHSTLSSQAREILANPPAPSPPSSAPAAGSSRPRRAAAGRSSAGGSGSGTPQTKGAGKAVQQAPAEPERKASHERRASATTTRKRALAALDAEADKDAPAAPPREALRRSSRASGAAASAGPGSVDKTTPSRSGAASPPNAVAAETRTLRPRATGETSSAVVHAPAAAPEPAEDGVMSDSDGAEESDDSLARQLTAALEHAHSDEEGSAPSRGVSPKAHAGGSRGKALELTAPDTPGRPSASLPSQSQSQAAAWVPPPTRRTVPAYADEEESGSDSDESGSGEEEEEEDDDDDEDLVAFAKKLEEETRARERG